MTDGNERRAGNMVLRRQPRPNYETVRDGSGRLFERFQYTNRTPREEEGAGCAWIKRRGRPQKGAFKPPHRWPVRKSGTRFDVCFTTKLRGEWVRHGLHPIGRAKSTEGLSSRAQRRGLQVQAGRQFHEYIPAGTYLPGGIYGMEYTPAEVQHLREVHANDPNVMWAITHSCLELPAGLARERNLPDGNLIIPDLKASGIVILINDGNVPNCRMVASIDSIGPAGRNSWVVSFHTTRDVYQKEELIAQYISVAN